MVDFHVPCVLALRWSTLEELELFLEAVALSRRGGRQSRTYFFNAMRSCIGLVILRGYSRR